MRRLMSTTRRTREASRRVTLRAGGAALALTFLVSLALTASSAQAIVVNDQGNEYGVALEPTTSLPSGVTVAPSVAGCPDPADAAENLSFMNNGVPPLCWQGGNVLHNNETFAITWDAERSYWTGTRDYVEQFLKDVADGSGTFTSPYALTGQYADATGRAAYASKYGGGCVDYGLDGGTSTSNTTCEYGNSVQTGPGDAYPSPNNCTPSGDSYNFSASPVNDVCLTDSDIQSEVASVASNTQMLTHLYSDSSGRWNPLVVVLLPPRVEVCLDSAGTLCSANSNASGKFCSYHSHMNVNGTDVAYVVQPWTAETGCDEPDATVIPQNPPVDQLAGDVGQRLVSPISQGELAAIVNPDLNGWYSSTGYEINDNDGCTPVGNGLDKVTVGSSSANPYLLQREFDNAAALETDPNTYFGCAPNVILNPTFVVPSAVDQGDDVLFDGSTTASTLMVANDKYQWSFGDGTPVTTGPSVVHSYAQGGTYNVTLTVTDRGGNKSTQTQSIVVLGPAGQTPALPPTTQPSSGGPSPALQVRVQLTPQSLKSVLGTGITLQVKSNRAADGILTVSISRSEAKRAHIKVGRGFSVVLARGTTAGIRNGVSTLRLRLPRSTAAKLRRLGRVALTVRLSLVASGGAHLAIDTAGRY